MRVLQLLGVQSVVLTNAAGGINLISAAGRTRADQRSHQSAGRESAGRRRTTTTSDRDFPICRTPISERFREIAKTDGRELGIPLSEGVYAAMLGPSV